MSIPTARPVKPGRNDPCPCGSGKKYKACCFSENERFRKGPAPDVAKFLGRGRRAVQEADFESAEFWYLQALQYSPNLAEALAGVGQCLCRRRRRREGLSFLHQAARQLEKDAAKNRDTRPINDLCGQLQHWGDMEAALRLARLAVRLAPNSPVTRNNLALCLSRVNRTEEAIPEADRACELLPDHPGCQILRAILSGHLRRFPEARIRLEAVIAADRDPVQTARAWLELATVLDKTGEYDPAFDACRRAAEGHAALPEVQGVDRDRIFNTLARDRDGFDRDLLHRWADSAPEDGLPAPVFLMGFLRSGTTLTEQVLAAHPEVITSDENDFISEVSQELERMSGIQDDTPASLRTIGSGQMKELRRFYWQRVQEEFGPEALQQRFVDKLALNSITIGLIATLFPDARILFALRDPRDVCLSCFMQAFSAAPGTVNLLSWEGIARQYAAVMDLWLHLRDWIPCRYLELRYEDTVGDFEATMRRVFDRIDVDWRPEVASFHERVRGRFISTPSFAAVSQPLYRSSLARWRHYEKHFEPVLPQLQRFIDAFGYGDAG